MIIIISLDGIEDDSYNGGEAKRIILENIHRIHY